MVASQNGHVEVVDKLLQHGANVDLQKKVLYQKHTSHSIHRVSLLPPCKAIMHCILP